LVEEGENAKHARHRAISLTLPGLESSFSVKGRKFGTLAKLKGEGGQFFFDLPGVNR